MDSGIIALTVRGRIRTERTWGIGWGMRWHPDFYCEETLREQYRNKIFTLKYSI
jgi:hypothetical protein